MGGIELRDYQLDALSRINNGSILCGGVGSGKSRTGIAYYFTKNGGKLKPYSDMDICQDLYIITTAKKRDSLEWNEELIPFLLHSNVDTYISEWQQIKDAKSLVNDKKWMSSLDPSDRKKIEKYSKKDLLHDPYYKGLTIHIDSWNNIKKYVWVKGAFFIFDEQRVVGKGEWVKSFLRIARQNEWILLSATPGDTWQDYIPVFVANGFYRNRTQFANEHIIWKPFARYQQVDRYVDTGRLIRLRNKILVDMDFNRETTPHHEYVNCLYDIPEYRKVQKERWDIWKQSPLESSAELCYALRKVTNSSEDRQVQFLDICDEHPRVICFYNFDYELDILKSMPYENGTEIREWNGHRHEEIPIDKDRWVYLVQYNAGSEGWNCIYTDTIVFYSQNYSYKTMTQAAGRIDRMNTPFRDLYYYHLTSKAPIDIAIGRALKEKKQFNERRYVDRYLSVY